MKRQKGGKGNHIPKRSQRPMLLVHLVVHTRVRRRRMPIIIPRGVHGSMNRNNSQRPQNQTNQVRGEGVKVEEKTRSKDRQRWRKGARYQSKLAILFSHSGGGTGLTFKSHFTSTLLTGPDPIRGTKEGEYAQGKLKGSPGLTNKTHQRKRKAQETD